MVELYKIYGPNINKVESIEIFKLSVQSIKKFVKLYLHSLQERFKTINNDQGSITPNVLVNNELSNTQFIDVITKLRLETFKTKHQDSNHLINDLDNLRTKIDNKDKEIKNN